MIALATIQLIYLGLIVCSMLCLLCRQENGDYARTKKQLLHEVRKEKFVSICRRVGIAHHHTMSTGCILSGSAQPTLLLADMFGFL
jgi:uncharacterized Fe-S cluster-containing radical SAM superfamily enzyme